MKTRVNCTPTFFAWSEMEWIWTSIYKELDTLAHDWNENVRTEGTEIWNEQRILKSK